LASENGRVVDLDEAVRSLRAAQAGLPRAQARAAQTIAEARARVEAARTALAVAIRAAADDGMRQRDIVARTGYSRERVRQIVAGGGDD
jgi:hypothetical protein